MCESTKVCTKCGAEKPFSDFYKDRSKSSGVRSICKRCSASNHARWYAENLEKVRVNSARWRAENPEKVRARVSRWRAENPEKAKALYVQSRAKNPEKANAYTACWRAKNPEKVKAFYTRRTKELPNSYVANALGIPTRDAPPELIELKREQLFTRRLTKQLINAIKEKQK